MTQEGSRLTGFDDESCQRVVGYLSHFTNPTRLKVLAKLYFGSSFVGEIVEAVEEKQAAVSQHLQRLLMAGLVVRQRSGKRVYYKLADGLVEDTIEFVIDLSERLQRRCDNPDNMEPDTEESQE